MKKMRNILIALGALAASLMTAACSDVHNTSAQTQNSAKSGITVSGSLSSGTGRSATSSLANDTITWKVAAATKGETGGPNYDSAILGSVSEDRTFTITLPEAGDYYFIATGYVTAEQETQVLQGKTDIINVTAEGRSNIVITAKPSSSEESGKISLPISDKSGKIANILIYEDGDDNHCFKESFLSKEVLFAHETTAGVHIYQFCFDDANGNTLYTCREAVTVFSSLTTDSWIGNAPYFVQNEDGTARFVITEELLTKYGTEVVPSTQTVLYSQYNAGGTTGYSYYLVESEDEEITEDKDPTVTTTYSDNSFCFDADGYFYALDTNASIKSSNTKITDESLSGVGNLSGITVDHATNILYAWYGMQSTFYIYKLPTFISQGNSEDMVTILPNFDSTVFGSENNGGNCYHDGELLVINNGKAYGFVSGGNPTLTNGKFYELDLTEDAPAAKLIDINEAIIDKLPEDSENAKITDMLYQDGAVYMLLKEMNTTISFFSRGALLRYNTLTSSVDTLGFSNQVDKSSLASAKLSAYTYDDNAYKPLYNDEARTTQWFVNADKGFYYGDDPKTLYNELPDIFTPAITTSISTEQFYGPSKFVAVKPKKLIIADDGIAFYTDNDVLKYKNVNRIVTVDLNSFSIVGTEDVSAKFSDESSKEIVIVTVSSLTMYQNAVADEVSSESPKYYENNDGARLTRVDGVYLVAPCGD